MELALERPQRPLRDFQALWRVSVDQMRRGGSDAAAGVSTAALALRGFSDQIPIIQNLSPIFERVSGAARTVGRAMDYIRERTGGLDADMSRVMRLTSDLGETLFGCLTLELPCDELRS